MKKKILIAEDDEDILLGLVDILEGEGYLVSSVRDGESCLQRYQAEPFDLIILDVMMPHKSGYDTCREIRRENATLPIIMLTAKGEEIDKVIGLELGADDYITKPFGVRELVARVKAVLRRSSQTSTATTTPDTFSFGNATIHRQTYTALNKRKQHSLTAREMKLIEHFAAHPGKAFSRDELLNAVWGIDYMGTTRTLDQHMAQLRKKIESDPASPTFLITIHGVGYRYDAS